METVQIYDTLNLVNKQMAGKVDITVTDTQSMVALGDGVLSSKESTEGFINTIFVMMYKDIVEGRAYFSNYRSLIKDSGQYAAYIRKLVVEMPELSEEDAIPLVDGQAVDQYIVKLPKVKQYVFVNRTPYVCYVTIQRRWLREAFRDERSMDAFIATIFLKIQNKLELAIEGMVKSAVNNYIGLCKSSQTLDLVTLYNTELGVESGDEGYIEPGVTALHNSNFMRFASGVIKEMMSNITGNSVLFNYEGEERFTPYSKQVLMLLSKFQRQLETVALYSAFNEDYLRIVDKKIVPYWQASGTSAMDYDSQSTVNVKTRQPNSDTVMTVSKKNVVAVLFDYDALGGYRENEEIATTPLNARGLFTNTFFHEQQMWINATDENFILFTLN